MTPRTTLPLLLLTLLFALSTAGLAEDGPQRDARGWLPGTPASNAGAIIAGIPDADMPELDVPKLLGTRVVQPTVVLYFSPTCPHCRAVGHEVQRLATRLEPHGASLLWVSSGSASAADIEEFRQTYGVTGEILHDTEREVVSAIGATSTPSALLLVPSGKRDKVKVRDVWYPYVPGYDGLVEGRVANNMLGVFREGEYRGDGHCSACHGTEYLSWALTHHSVAWPTLQKKQATEDEACNGCHVTGKGEPTGWAGDPHGKLVNVTCEACHGPGGPHDGTRTDPAETCATCHDAKHSIAFSVEKGLPHIDHYLADHVDEAAYTERRRALYKGEAPKPLLDFADGKNLGAAACLECHPTQHAQWADSPHAKAMASLDKDDKRSDPACVACHATAKTSGIAPSTLDGFRTGDGVGCESCHGPGEAHAANPTRDNIEGLGEDCPVCVIEAVCTRCHTAEWDPLWDLDEKLPKAGHQTK